MAWRVLSSSVLVLLHVQYSYPCRMSNPLGSAPTPIRLHLPPLMTSGLTIIAVLTRSSNDLRIQ